MKRQKRNSHPVDDTASYQSTMDEIKRCLAYFESKGYKQDKKIAYLKFYLEMILLDIKEQAGTNKKRRSGYFDFVPDFRFALLFSISELLYSLEKQTSLNSPSL